MNKRPVTILCDIDGTLVKHNPPIENTDTDKDFEILPGTVEKLLEWDSLGYNIILITGRRESMRKSTENQLSKIGIIYDSLIMGIGGGKRYLINDRKPSGEEYAFSINLDRNEGISGVEIIP
jgi:hydroxymethylpyrimidine pyrophosphatase-like HAD family hydrolase